MNGVGFRQTLTVVRLRIVGCALIEVSNMGGLMGRAHRNLSVHFDGDVYTDP